MNINFTDDEALKSTTFKEECGVLRSLIGIIKEDISWTDEAKKVVIHALNCGIGSMLIYGALIERGDDLK